MLTSTPPSLIRLAPRDIAASRRAAALRRLLGDLIGGLVATDGLTDVDCNSDGRIWASFLGQKPRCVGSIAAADAEKLVFAVAKAAGESISRDRPSLSAELEADDGEGTCLLRIQAYLPPAVPGPSFSIRKPTGRIIGLDEYLDQGVITARQHARLERAVADRENILICGGTGSGKSTLMNALLASVATITPDDRIVCIERTRELQCRSENREMLRVTPTYPAQTALQDVLRSHPDRIMVGEVRGAESLDMIMAWQTGHDGGYCTIHAKTKRPDARAALRRLERTAALANPNADFRPDIGDTVDVVVCIRKDFTNATVGRRVSHIAEIHGWNGDDYNVIEEDLS